MKLRIGDGKIALHLMMIAKIVEKPVGFNLLSKYPDK